MQQPLIQPFAAIRPAPGRAADIIARPYDVLSFAEAKAGAAGRPWSFLHVSRAEIDLPAEVDAHSDAVYAQAARAFAAMQSDAVLVRDAAPAYYAYRMIVDGHVQTGLATAASTEAYAANRIRRHEHTRPDKEFDRTRQIEAVGAHTGPVLAAHLPSREIAMLLEAATLGEPSADAVTDDGVRHQVWPIVEHDAVERITAGFEAMAAIYIADGHHRSAAALRVARQGGDGRFLLVSFPADQMRILGYNRIIRDLNGRSPEQLIAEVGDAFAVEASDLPVDPHRAGTFGMYLGGRWHRLSLREPLPADVDAVERLDVSLLMARILGPILGIGDPRTDQRIDFVGGGRGVEALAQRVDAGDWSVAFSLYPTALADLMAVADAGQVMPPKSTWFEPKLADGLLSLPLAG
ncbi:MAG: DUF1015 domain-containing protein [Rhodospirillales bacterium]|nr:DUF1015 domain-containing protein [Rhodospirillales bacterium]